MSRTSVVPAFLDNGTWSASFGLSLMELYMKDAVTRKAVMNENATHLRKVCGAAGISDARNEVAASFLDGTKAEWLWMVDTDMGFDPDTVSMLLDSAHKTDRPIMGALCFAFRKVETGPLHADRYGIIPTIYKYVELENEVGFAPVSSYPKDEVIEVSATGAACLLIHRYALDTIRKKYGDTWFDQVGHPNGNGPGKRRMFSEDLSFCVKAAGAGLPIHVDTSIKTSHHKGVVYLDEQAFQEQMMGEPSDVPD